MENVSIKDVVLEKKTENFNPNMHNFVASSELTVTITLAEYRELVEKVATSDSAIRTAEQDKYTRNQENDRLQKEVAALKAELYEYRKKFDSANTEAVAERG